MLMFLIMIISMGIAAVAPKTKSGERKDGVNAFLIARQSSSSQDTVDEQMEWLETTVKNYKLKEVGKISKTCKGEVFPIKYRNRILKVAKAEGVDYIVLFRIDRFSRKSAAGIRLLDDLHSINHIRILSTEGLFDYENPNERLMARFWLLLAEQELFQKNSRVSLKIGHMLSHMIYPRKISPFGYKLDENSLLYKETWCKKIRKEINDDFINNKNFSKTAQKINDEYGKIIERNLNGTDIKHILQNKIYIGYLEWGGEVYGEGDDNKPHEHLKVITEDEYSEAQKIVKQIDDVYSRSHNSIKQELIEKYGFLNVNEIMKYQPPCPNCGKYKHINNGSEKIKNFIQKKYICCKCKTEFRSPLIRQVKKIHNLSSYPCKKCESINKFTLLNDRSGFWQLRCEICGHVIFLSNFADVLTTEKNMSNAKKRDGKKFLKTIKKPWRGKNQTTII